MSPAVEQLFSLVMTLTTHRLDELAEGISSFVNKL